MCFAPTQTELVDWNHCRTFFGAVLSGDLSRNPDVNEQVLAMTGLEIQFGLGNYGVKMTISVIWNSLQSSRHHPIP